MCYQRAQHSPPLSHVHQHRYTHPLMDDPVIRKADRNMKNTMYKLQANSDRQLQPFRKDKNLNYGHQVYPITIPVPEKACPQ